MEKLRKDVRIWLFIFIMCFLILPGVAIIVMVMDHVFDQNRIERLYEDRENRYFNTKP